MFVNAQKYTRPYYHAPKHPKYSPGRKPRGGRGKLGEPGTYGPGCGTCGPGLDHTAGTSRQKWTGVRISGSRETASGRRFTLKSVCHPRNRCACPEKFDPVSIRKLSSAFIAIGKYSFCGLPCPYGRCNRDLVKGIRTLLRHVVPCWN